MAEKDWQHIGQVLKARMTEKEPNIKVEDVRDWLGLSSTSVAYFYLLTLKEMGIVKQVKNGGKSEWFIAW